MWVYKGHGNPGLIRSGNIDFKKCGWREVSGVAKFFHYFS